MVVGPNWKLRMSARPPGFHFRYIAFANFCFAPPIPFARGIVGIMLAGALKRIGTAAKPSITTTTDTTSTKSASGDGRNS